MGGMENQSKNAKRKADRLEKIRLSRKANRKLKKELAKQKRKEHQNSDTEHVSKKVAKNEAIERLNHVYSNPDEHLKICIDLQFENLMNDKELTHLARQLSRAYGFNKKW